MTYSLYFQELTHSLNIFFFFIFIKQLCWRFEWKLELLMRKIEEQISHPLSSLELFHSPIIDLDLFHLSILAQCCFQMLSTFWNRNGIRILLFWDFLESKEDVPKTLFIKRNFQLNIFVLLNSNLYFVLFFVPKHFCVCVLERWL